MFSAIRDFFLFIKWSYLLIYRYGLARAVDIVSYCYVFYPPDVLNEVSSMNPFTTLRLIYNDLFYLKERVFNHEGSFLDIREDILSTLRKVLDKFGTI